MLKKVFVIMQNIKGRRNDWVYIIAINDWFTGSRDSWQLADSAFATTTSRAFHFVRARMPALPTGLSSARAVRALARDAPLHRKKRRYQNGGPAS